MEESIELTDADIAKMRQALAIVVEGRTSHYYVSPEMLAALLDAAAERNRMRRELHELTPMGSEFANSPDRCIAWIRAELTSRLEHAVMNAAECNRLRRLLEQKPEAQP